MRRGGERRAGVRYDIEVRVEPGVAHELDPARLRRLAHMVLAAEGVTPGAGATIVLTTDSAIQALNLAYRHADRPTDVLSFAIADSASEGADAFVVADEACHTYLGDVIISADTAAMQAVEAGHSIDEELNVLAIHGVLHLLGYDDEEPDVRAAMWTRQRELLSRWNARQHGSGATNRKALEEGH